MSHLYGPHRPEDNPRSVTVHDAGNEDGKWPQEIEIPYPDALAIQRSRVNNIAWAQARGGGAQD